MDNFSIKEFALGEFNHEMTTTRKILERVPFDKSDWVPHAKSSPLGRLAVHVAALSGMGVDVITKDEFFFGGKYDPPVVKSTQDLLAMFEEKSGATRAALEATTDEALVKNWKFVFKNDQTEQVLFEGPRFTAFQTFMMNHHIHHRAQLGVYLRLNDVEIPGSYGPSADEKM
jgi:uncharacterized damage-inducible protein DinB